MRIAFFIDDYLPSVHGVATSVVNYKEALESLGHEVFVVAPKYEGYEDHDDHVIRMPSLKNYVFDKRSTATIYPGLARKLDKYNFDIVHSQTQFYLGVLAHSVARRQKIPHVTTIHTLYTELIDDYPFMVTAGILASTVALPVVLRMKPVGPSLSREEIMRMSKDTMKEIMSRQGWRLTAAFANRCDACISPSKHLAEILTNQGGLTVPYYLFPNSINTMRYKKAVASDSPVRKKTGEKFIICVARLSPEKRQHILIDAMQCLSDARVKLILVGGGPSEESLKQRASERGVGERVIFTGMQPANVVASLLKQADVFALASYHFDNQPMTFLEAAASGLPIVYCDEQMTEGLTKKNAILVDGIEGADFANVFNDLFANKDHLKELSRGALSVGKQFDSLTMSKKLVRLYEDLLETHRQLAMY